MYKNTAKYGSSEEFSERDDNALFTDPDFTFFSWFYMRDIITVSHTLFQGCYIGFRIGYTWLFFAMLAHRIG